MTVTNGKDELEDQFVRWREHVRRRPELLESDADELEDHLRDSVDALAGLGLSRDEAFLVAIKRMGGLDELSREFAREHSERLWKQLMFTGGPGDPARSSRSRRDLWAMLVCAFGAAVSIKLPELFGASLSDGDFFYATNLGLFTLPWLAGFLVWRRRPAPWVYGVLVALFALGAVLANAYPAGDDSQSAGLLVSHLPLALWLVVGLAYISDDLRSARRRMDFIRFTGEWFVYVVLMMLGGGVLMFDLLLAVVLGLLLYSLSARDPRAPRGPFDVMQLALVISALLIDALVLYTMAGRIAEYGTTPNNVTAIGQNIVLLVNLAWSAWLLLGFVRRRTGFAAVERWQTRYVPVYAVWFWTVVLILPPVFSFR